MVLSVEELLEAADKETLKELDSQEIVQQKRKASVNAKPKKNAATIIENSYVVPFRNQNNNYMCLYCPRVFFDPKDLREHTLGHPVNKKTIYKNLPFHGRPAKIDVTTVNCRLCEERIYEVDVLKRHLASRHGVAFQDGGDGVLQFRLAKTVMSCVICQKQYNAFNTLNSHMNAHFDSYICEICGRGFMSYPRLRTHRSSHFDGKYPCHLCDRVLASKLKRQKHVAFFHKTRSLATRCPECGETFADCKKRVRHQQEVHGKERLPQPCQLCAKVFASATSLTQHVRRDHRLERPHACSRCDKRFFSLQYLKEHEVWHTGEMFHCEMCSSSFKWKRSLVRHIKLHNAGRIFAPRRDLHSD